MDFEGQSKSASSEYLSLANAENLDDEQLGKLGSVELDLIQSAEGQGWAALVVVCIANKQEENYV